MKKNLTGISLGIAGSLWILIMAVISVLLSAELSNFFNSSDPILTPTNIIDITPMIILSWFMLVGSVIGIIGAILSLKNSKIGGILLSVSAITALAFSIYRIYIIDKTETTIIVITWIFLYIIPTVLTIISVILLFSTKNIELKEEKKENELKPEQELINDIKDYFKYHNKKGDFLVFDKSMNKEYDFEAIKKELTKNNFFITRKNEEWTITKTK